MALDFSGAMRERARELSIRGAVAYAGGVTRALSGGDIVGFTISEGSEAGILPGDVLCASCALILDNRDGRWLPGGAMRGYASLRGAEFRLEIGVKSGGEYAYAPLGVYLCDSVSSEENGAAMALTLYDSIDARTGAAFQDTLSYPKPLSAVWERLALAAGYSFSGAIPNGNLIIDAPPAWGDATVRTAMGFVAQIAGCFVRVSRSGALELAPVAPGGEPIPIMPASYLSRRRLEGTYGPVNRLVVTTVNHREDGDSEPYDVTAEPENATEVYSFTVTGNPLFITGGAHLGALVRGMRDAISGLKYVECRFTWRGDPSVLPGAKLNVLDTQGNGTICALSRQTMRFDGGFRCECVSGMPDAVESAHPISRSGGVDAGKIIGVIGGGNIAASAITASKIDAGAVSTEKIQASAVTADKIQTGAVNADKLAAAAVTAEKIQAGAVSADKLAAAAVTADKIDAGAVTAGKLAASSVTAEKIDAGAVSADKLAAASVTAVKIAAGAVTAGKLAASSVTAEKCAAGLISAGSAIIADGAIGTAQIANGSITSAKVVSLSADVIDAGTLSVDRLLVTGADSVVYEINASSAGLTATQLSQEEYRNRLSGTVIVAESITSAQIAANAITANKIVAGAITAEKVDVQSLFAAAATIAEIRTMTVSSLEAGTEVSIGSDHFKVAFEDAEEGNFSITLGGGEEGQQIMRADRYGGHFSALSVSDRIDCDKLAWRYDGPSSYADIATFVGVLDKLNHCYLDYDVTISVSPAMPAIRESVVLAGIRGPGSVTIEGRQKAAPSGVDIVGCTAKITFRELYAEYREVRSPHVYYEGVSTTGTYVASGTVSAGANPTRIKRAGATWMSTADFAWQGYTESSGQMSACFWFPGLSQYATAAIQAATVRLKRVSGIGKGDRVNLVAYTATNSAPSGNLAGLASWGTIGTIAEGEMVTVAIPPAAAAVLCAGGCLALSPGDTAPLSGKTYSSNYAKFYGYGTEYAPVFTVTYEKTGQTVTATSTFVRDTQDLARKLEADWVSIAPANGTTPGAHGNGPLRCRTVGSRLYVAGGVDIAWSASKVICTLPHGPKYANQYFLRPCSGSNVARVYVGTDGVMRLEWVKSLTDGSNQTSFNNWVDLNLDFWMN